MGIDLDRMRTVVQRAPGPPRGIIAALGLGVAFGVGTLVGSGAEARAIAPVDGDGDGDALIAASARADKLDETRAKLNLKLTYASELTKPDPAEPRRAAPGKAAQTAKLDVAEPLEVTPPEVTPPEVTPPAPAPTETPPESSPAARDTNGEPAEQADNGDGGAEDVEKRSGDDLKAALARVVEDVQPAGKYTLQVAAAPTQSGADEFVRKLSAAGHTGARVVEGQVGGKPVFRVRVGAFPDRAAADAYKAKLTMPAFIVSE